jgi:hypothetical protein
MPKIASGDRYSLVWILSVKCLWVQQALPKSTILTLIFFVNFIFICSFHLSVYSVSSSTEGVLSVSYPESLALSESFFFYSSIRSPSIVFSTFFSFGYSSTIYASSYLSWFLAFPFFYYYSPFFYYCSPFFFFSIFSALFYY